MTKPLKKFGECGDGHGLKSPGHQTRTLCGPEILAVTAMAGEEEKVLEREVQVAAALDRS